MGQGFFAGYQNPNLLWYPFNKSFWREFQGGELKSTFDYLHELSSKDIKIDMANVWSDCFNPFSFNFWKRWHMETKIKNNRIKANFWKEPMCPDEDSPVEETWSTFIINEASFQNSSSWTEPIHSVLDQKF